MRIQRVLLCVPLMAVSIACGSGSDTGEQSTGDTAATNPHDGTSGAGTSGGSTGGASTSGGSTGGASTSGGSTSGASTSGGSSDDASKSPTADASAPKDSGSSSTPDSGAAHDSGASAHDSGASSQDSGGSAHDSGASGHDSGGTEDSGSSTGTIFLQDTFNGTCNADVAGTSPEKNLPGGKFVVDQVNVSGGDFASFFDCGTGESAPALHLFDVGGSSGSAAISIASAGSYVKPAQFSIQAQLMTLNPSTVLFLGFYETPPATGKNSLTGLTGLAVHTDTGSIDLVVGGAVKDNIAFTGPFSPGAYSTLAYTVDTTTGGISDVSLASSKSKYDFSTTAFTNSATNYAAVGTEAGGPSGACSYFDNLTLTAK